MICTAILVTCCIWPADLEHDKFYGELPAAMRADVAAEIVKEVFDESCFLSVLVRSHAYCFHFC